MSPDEALARCLVKAIDLELDAPKRRVAELQDIVDRTQNDGSMSEPVWTALRDLVWSMKAFNEAVARFERTK